MSNRQTSGPLCWTPGFPESHKDILFREEGGDSKIGGGLVKGEDTFYECRGFLSIENVGGSVKWYDDVININDDHLWMSTSKQSVLSNVLEVVLVQRRSEPDDDDNHNDDEVDDDLINDGVDDDDLSLLQPAANVAFLLFCSANHSSKPLYQ